jgi:catechol 2,3-dioxygenase-like lactoylglutathione lyase family enzyme
MAQNITLLSIVVRDYDEAIAFYVEKLGFELVEDTDLGTGKRWVRVRPRGSTGAGLLLARATNDAQLARGVTFVRAPSEEP